MGGAGPNDVGAERGLMPIAVKFVIGDLKGLAVAIEFSAHVGVVKSVSPNPTLSSVSVRMTSTCSGRSMSVERPVMGMKVFSS